MGRGSEADKFKTMNGLYYLELIGVAFGPGPNSMGWKLRLNNTERRAAAAKSIKLIRG